MVSGNGCIKTASGVLDSSDTSIQKGGSSKFRVLCYLLETGYMCPWFTYNEKSWFHFKWCPSFPGPYILQDRCWFLPVLHPLRLYNQHLIIRLRLQCSTEHVAVHSWLQHLTNKTGHFLHVVCRKNIGAWIFILSRSAQVLRRISRSDFHHLCNGPSVFKLMFFPIKLEVHIVQWPRLEHWGFQQKLCWPHSLLQLQKKWRPRNVHHVSLTVNLCRLLSIRYCMTLPFSQSWSLMFTFIDMVKSGQPFLSRLQPHRSPQNFKINYRSL